MELNRNKVFAAGLVVLLLGIQLRVLERYVLNQSATDVVTKYIKRESEQRPPALFLSAAPLPSQGEVIEPPVWLGWTLISVGAVLILHSLAMRKPGG